LGLILYEMLAGKLAFERPSAIETMNAILRDEVPDLPATVPPALQGIVMHCLEKEPSQRYQSAQDLAFALRTLSGSTATSAAARPIPKPHRRLLPAAVALLCAFAIYTLAGLFLTSRGIDLAAYRFTPVASGSTEQGNASWSPDGNSLAYIKTNPGALNSLMIRSLEAMLPVTVARAEFNGAPFWSPDGARLMFVARGGIYSVSRAGGVQQQVLKAEYVAAALSPDGRSLADWLSQDEKKRSIPKLWISSPPGSAPRKYEPVIWQSNGATQPVYLRFSPDSRQLAVSLNGNGGAELWLLPFPDGTAAHGKPHRVFQSSIPSWAPSISWMPDSRHLVLAFAAPYKMSQLWMGDTRTGALAPITSGESDVSRGAVSPDGNRIAYDSVKYDEDLVQSLSKAQWSTPFSRPAATSRQPHGRPPRPSSLMPPTAMGVPRFGRRARSRVGNARS